MYSVCYPSMLRYSILNNDFDSIPSSGPCYFTSICCCLELRLSMKIEMMDSKKRGKSLKHRTPHAMEQTKNA